jgi:hypothetical protein
MTFFARSGEKASPSSKSVMRTEPSWATFSVVDIAVMSASMSGGMDYHSNSHSASSTKTMTSDGVLVRQTT